MATMQRFNSRTYLQPKQKKLGCFKIFSCFLIILLFVGIVYGFSQYRNYKNFTKDGNSHERFLFEVKSGESLEQISKRLSEEGFMRNNKVFNIPAYKIYLKLNSFDAIDIQAGTHELSKDSSPSQIFKNLRANACTEVKVTLREGLRIEEFADVLDKTFKAKPNSKFDKEEFIGITRSYKNVNNIQFSFTPPTNLEGYLFPDTYSFCHSANARAVVETLLQNFNKKIAPFRDEIANNSRSLNDIINIASMIEREVRTFENKKIVAGIIINRLDYGMPLGIDATSQYGFGYLTSENTWWRQGTELDKVINTEHPYSTRKNTGLPPTPISNPGIDSIRSVLEYTKTDYLYYITADGKMYFATNQAGHEENVCKYIFKTCN